MVPFLPTEVFSCAILFVLSGCSLSPLHPSPRNSPLLPLPPLTTRSLVSWATPSWITAPWNFWKLLPIHWRANYRQSGVARHRRAAGEDAKRRGLRKRPQRRIQTYFHLATRRHNR